MNKRERGHFYRCQREGLSFTYRKRDVHTHKQTRVRLFQFFIIYSPFYLFLFKWSCSSKSILIIYCFFVFFFFTEENTVQPFFFSKQYWEKYQLHTYSLIVRWFLYQCQVQEIIYNNVHSSFLNILGTKPKGVFDKFCNPILQYFSIAAIFQTIFKSQFALVLYFFFLYRLPPVPPKP